MPTPCKTTYGKLCRNKPTKTKSPYQPPSRRSWILGHFKWVSPSSTWLEITQPVVRPYHKYCSNFWAWSNRLLNSSFIVVIGTQERFLLRKSANSTDTHIYRWWVPLTHVSGSNSARRSEWISDAEATKTIANLGVGANDWVIFNFDQQS